MRLRFPLTPSLPLGIAVATALLTSLTLAGRPAVAQDGGDITFHGFDRGVVYLHMKGACAGCPSMAAPST